MCRHIEKRIGLIVRLIEPVRKRAGHVAPICKREVHRTNILMEVIREDTQWDLWRLLR
jgi:hypothetical protein